MEEKQRQKTKTKKKPSTIIGHICVVFFSTLAMIFIILYGAMWIICHGPSEEGKRTFVNTFLETGALAFLPSWYLSEAEIEQLADTRGVLGDVDPSIITIPKETPAQQETKPGETTAEPSGYKDNFDENGVEIIEIVGRSYYGKLMKIKDPSKVSVATIYPWSSDAKEKNGVTLDVLVKNGGGIAGINGGEYCSDGNWGGRPKGLVVCNGQIQFNAPQYGDVMVGFNDKNILIIKEISGMSAEQVAAYVTQNAIRDAVSFKDIADGDVNHFTKLIINNEAIQISGNGSGANPRTVIGQRSDGTVLMFVTDGRGASGHIGATAADLISVMKEYGAVNAANLDGGSSSAMVYKDKFEMTSVTLYYSTSSWQLPTGFIVKK